MAVASRWLVPPVAPVATASPSLAAAPSASLPAVAAPHVIAVDWSGRSGADQAETIWVAEVAAGRLVALRNGLTRAQVVASLAEAAGRHDDLVVGLDFAFSLPAWWIESQGLRDARSVWRFAAAEGERLLAEKHPPFWGAAGSVAAPPERRFRRTEERARAAGLPAKSVLQLAGAGAVGVGSLRGMPCLLALAEQHGFSVWPFDPPAPARVLEIYPRALTGPVDKGRWTTRHAHLFANFAEQDPALLERAAGSQDAFDAAVSALVMARHADDLARLAQTADPVERLEGRIWLPA